MKHLYDKNGKYIGSEVDYEEEQERRERQEERKQREWDRLERQLDDIERRQKDKKESSHSAAGGDSAEWLGLIGFPLLIWGIIWLFKRFFAVPDDAYLESGHVDLFAWAGSIWNNFWDMVFGGLIGLQMIARIVIGIAIVVFVVYWIWKLNEMYKEKKKKKK